MIARSGLKVLASEIADPPLRQERGGGGHFAGFGLGFLLQQRHHRQQEFWA